MVVRIGGRNTFQLFHRLDGVALDHELVDHALDLGSAFGIVEHRAIAREHRRRHVPGADAQVLAFQTPAEVQPWDAVLVLVLAARSDGHIGRDVGLVRRLVPPETRIALDAEVVRLSLDDTRIDGYHSVAQLLDEQLERAATQAQKIGLMGFEPGPTLLGLELEEELNGLVRKTLEAFELRGHGCHVPQCTRLQSRQTLVRLNSTDSSSGNVGTSYVASSSRPSCGA